MMRSAAAGEEEDRVVQELRAIPAPAAAPTAGSLTATAVGEHSCVKCAAPCCVKEGKFGRFLACSNFYTTGCRYTMSLSALSALWH